MSWGWCTGAVLGIAIAFGAPQIVSWVRECSAFNSTSAGIIVSTRNAGLTADPLFVGATRPPMRWGVTYSALLFNLVFSMEVFLLTKNLLATLVVVPIHAVSVLLCARDARFFDLVLLWGERDLRRCWRICASVKRAVTAPLALDPPNARSHRRSARYVRAGRI